ncbi:MAG: hypothetical protein ABL907_09110 [Hyphomicrobium sp.]
MRRLVVSSLLVALSASFVQAADCTGDVVAAFDKQRTSKAFRVAMTQPTAEGEVEMTVDYLPPDKMLQTVKSPAMPGDQQTMLVGSRAFAGSSGSFEELLPQFTQSIVAEVQTALGGTGKAIGTFECLGKMAYEGRDLLAFRASDKEASPGTAPEHVMARTVYVDPASGLPAFNVVASEAGKDKPAVKVIYTYPEDIVIEAPVGAPIQKIR